MARFAQTQTAHIINTIFTTEIKKAGKSAKQREISKDDGKLNESARPHIHIYNNIVCLCLNNMLVATICNYLIYTKHCPLYFYNRKAVLHRSCNDLGNSSPFHGVIPVVGFSHDNLEDYQNPQMTEFSLDL